MTYANGKTLLDADSHLMESHDWLESYADEATRKLLGEMGMASAGKAAPGHIAAGQRRMQDAAATAAVEEDVMRSAKGWLALGAMSSAERSRALDLMGMQAQLVFSTFAATQFAFSKDPAVAYGGAAAHNRGIVEFCEGDDRLLPVGFVPLTTFDGAARCLEAALTQGCSAIWVPHVTAEGKSPAHVEMDRFWSILAEAGVPFLLHIGGGKSNLAAPLHDNGRPMPADFVGGGENVRAKDFPSVHHSAETFLSVLVLDGVFERHPDLRCGAIELGATWVPGMMQRLDAAKASFGRNEPLLSELALEPSDYVRRQVRFTPFAFEDVGALIEATDPSLYLFSTDYPHPEGTRDPLGRFETSLDAHTIGDQGREAFFHENFTSMFGPSARTWLSADVAAAGRSAVDSQ